ncbi:3'(2'),5'-bisphosphate nucleotidase CysQ [Pasteurella atlantica]|uniref:3'(2'),5'-bisphosphate nucleotidase CysQ n=1 Tax=Pasteurellaceae TaxID=712 RepID=UPI00274817BD|nr:3'(2'),5'-bisphosphate nucleotidase CysQ [Pasteurella atlantica]MDP8098335.1 3'(2'),5'-bisphosphate nucleotidase CysQ [Pasteurella atlantica]MDP8106613.1 3'(2'),5'-bisphosphate nucleotidase CysQ [Pasteurella atlantica]MDP8116138.1 3'(2'),5'-bisphosphate nucleotidase CysQ [Pasteurella atlantica]
MQQLNQSLLDIVYQAGRHLAEFYTKSVEITIKPDSSPVTEADLFLSKFLIEELSKLTPNIPILSEENCQYPLSEREKWNEYWIVDPLDGTQQFIDRTDHFSIMIALVRHNKPVLGIIHAPILDKTYYAMENQGAFLIEKGEAHRLEKNCKKLERYDRLIIAVGSGKHTKIKNSIQHPFEFLRCGSSSLKAGLVAEGKADCYISFGKTGEWDTAAAEVILSEVGGEIYNLNFEPLTYNQRETLINPPFLMVGNKKINWQKMYQFNS